MAGSMGGKPTGSMAPSGMVEDLQRQAEMARQTADASATADRAEKDRQDDDVKKREAEIDKLLPEKVDTAFGTLAYASFKLLYADVFEAVSLKDHFAMGYVTHETKFTDGTVIRVRTFRRAEGDALRSLTPRSSVIEGSTMEAFYKESAKYDRAKILLGLVQFGDKTFGDPIKFTIDNIDKWFAHPDIQARLGWYDNLPDVIVGFLDRVLEDTMSAYRAALTENLKNLLPPLSHITA